MNVDINFFKSIYNDDIIYHYTKASTAIDLILYNNQAVYEVTSNVLRVDTTSFWQTRANLSEVARKSHHWPMFVS